MATLTRFEDIEAWKRARELTRLIYEASRQGEFSRDAALRDQISRAAISVMANIAEGFERGGNREFRQFLSLAKGSAGEVKSHLCVARDAGYLTREQSKELSDRTAEVGRILGGFIQYLAGCDLKGVKFRQDKVLRPALPHNPRGVDS